MKELKKDMIDAGISIPEGKCMQAADLQALAQRHGMQTTTQKQKILPGWESKRNFTHTLGAWVDCQIRL